MTVGSGGQVILGGNAGVRLDDPLTSRGGQGEGQGSAMDDALSLSPGYMPVLAVDPGQYADGSATSQWFGCVKDVAWGGAAGGAVVAVAIEATATPGLSVFLAGASTVNAVVICTFGPVISTSPPDYSKPAAGGHEGGSNDGRGGTGGAGNDDTRMPSPEPDGYSTPSVTFPRGALPTGGTVTPPQPSNPTGVPVVAVTGSPGGAPGGSSPWTNPGPEAAVPTSVITGTRSLGTLPPDSLDPWINPGLFFTPTPEESGSGGQSTGTGGASTPRVVTSISWADLANGTSLPTQGPNIDPAPVLALAAH
jgi:hypothetical protein